MKSIGFGRWADKSGEMTHTTKDGKLVPVPRAAKPKKTTEPIGTIGTNLSGDEYYKWIKRGGHLARSKQVGTQKWPEQGVSVKNSSIVIKNKKNKAIGTITKLKTKSGEEFLSVRSTHPSVPFVNNTFKPGEEKDAAASLHSAVDYTRKDLDMRIKEATQKLKILLKQKKEFEK